VPSRQKFWFTQRSHSRHAFGVRDEETYADADTLRMRRTNSTCRPTRPWRGKHTSRAPVRRSLNLYGFCVDLAARMRASVRLAKMQVRPGVTLGARLRPRRLRTGASTASTRRREDTSGAYPQRPSRTYKLPCHRAAARASAPVLPVGVSGTVRATPRKRTWCMSVRWIGAPR
jgi:hypothetical protein